MQQQDGGVCRVSRFAVKNVQPVNRNRFMANAAERFRRESGLYQPKTQQHSNKNISQKSCGITRHCDISPSDHFSWDEGPGMNLIWSGLEYPD